MKVRRTFGKRAYESLQGAVMAAPAGYLAEGVKVACLIYRRARIARGLTVRDVAVTSSIGYNTLRQHFDGNIDTNSVETLLAICRALRLQVWIVPVGWDGRPERLRLDGEFTSIAALKRGEANE